MGKKTTHLCTNCNFLCFVPIKKTIQCLLASEVIQFDIMLHVAPKGKSFHSAWQPSITVFSVKYSGEVTQPWGAPELMGQDCYPQHPEYCCTEKK